MQGLSALGKAVRQYDRCMFLGAVARLTLRKASFPREQAYERADKPDCRCGLQGRG